MILHFALPLAVTLAAELPVAAALGLRTRLALGAVAAASLVTNPLLTYAGLLLAHFVEWDKSWAMALAVVSIGEVAVILGEWRLLAWALGGDERRLLKVATLMNLASALVGIVFWV